MRYIYLLLITFIFAACGNQNMRFIRNNSTKQKVVEINDIPSLKVKTETANIPEINTEVPAPENAAANPTDVESDESTEEETTRLPETISTSFPETVQDSTTVSADEAQFIKNEALRAEKLGNWSFALALFFFAFVLFSILASIFAFALNYSPVMFVLSIFFAILALGSIITSLILGSKSLSSAYNTRKGRSRAIIGVIISSIILTIMLVNLAFTLF